jgi:NTP pyrophosphatase (non-canonical NTP hydrolase)
MTAKPVERRPSSAGAAPRAKGRTGPAAARRRKRNGERRPRRDAKRGVQRAKTEPRGSSGQGATLADLQQRVHAWIAQFEEGYWPPLSMLARLTEEVGELARELNHHYGHKPKKGEEPEGDIALEIGDIVFVLVCLCNSLGIDLDAAFKRVIEKYEQRDARRWTPKRGATA